MDRFGRDQRAICLFTIATRAGANSRTQVGRPGALGLRRNDSLFYFSRHIHRAEGSVFDVLSP